MEEMPAELEDPGSGPSKAARAGTIFGFLLVLALTAGVILLALALLPGKVPQETNPRWLDLIVDNRWVVWLIRLMGLAIMVMFAMFSIYFVRSINHRMSRGHWLRSGAGLEAEIVSDALDDLGPLLENLAEAEGRAEELEGQLGASNEAIQELYTLLSHVDEAEIMAAAERAQTALAEAGGDQVNGELDTLNGA
jgi:hypothetical protein